MKSSRSILRRLVRNIGEMYIAKPVGEADSFARNLPRTTHVVVAFVRALYDSRMYKWFCLQFRCSVFLFVVGMTTSALADEGMWLFNAPPLKQLKEKYQFEPDAAMVEASPKSERPFQLRRQRLV